MAGMQPIARATLLVALTGLVVSCASPRADYPTLAVRDAERVQGQFVTGEPVRLDVPPVEVDLAGGLDARLASLVAAAQEAHADFLSIEPRAQRLVAASGNSGSDSWAAAQVALAELDSARSRAAIPLGDLDAIYTSARVSASEVAAIETARGEVIALVAEEDASLAQLRGRMK